MGFICSGWVADVWSQGGGVRLGSADVPDWLLRAGLDCCATYFAVACSFCVPRGSRWSSLVGCAGFLLCRGGLACGPWSCSVGSFDCLCCEACFTVDGFGGDIFTVCEFDVRCTSIRCCGSRSKSVKRVLRDASQAWNFFRSGFTSWETTAAFLPSQRFLVRTLVSAARLNGARNVVELGPGLGHVTSKILARMGHDCQLYSVEIDPAMVEAMATKVTDPRLHVIEGDAAKLPQLLEQAGCTGPVDAVISSLGMSLLPPEVRESIFTGIKTVLAPGKPYVQYAYFHARVIVWTGSRGFSQFNIREHLAPHFGQMQRQLVFANVPPAAVYTCSNS